MLEAGFREAQLYALEGLGNVVPDFDTLWEDGERRERLLDVIRRTEQDPALFGVSAHLLAVGRA